jgi:hypothetical protein
MKKILLGFADQTFIVDPATAAKVQRSLPPDRYVTTTVLKDDDDEEDEDKKDSNNNPLRPKRESVFSRYQQPLSPKEQRYVQRFAAHLAKKEPQPKRK